MANWEKIYEDGDIFRAEIVKNAMEANEIPAVILNKRDTAYNNFGLLEVYVAKTDKDRAIKILREDVRFGEII